MARRILSPALYCAVFVLLAACDRAGPATHAAPESSSSSAPLAASAAPSALAPAAAAKCDLETKKLDYVAWTPDGKFLITAGTGHGKRDGDKAVEDGSVDAWDLEKGERVFTFHLGTPKDERRSLILAYAADGK